MHTSLRRSRVYPVILLLICLHAHNARASLMQLQPQSSSKQEICNEDDLKECAVAADSLVKDASLVFPDSPSSLDRVCRTWDKFISCISNFTRKCYTSTEKARFDQSFNKPISSMNTLCKDDSYRQDYLVYAPCIKKITTDGGYCGFQYQMLIDQISNNQVGLKQLCCARSKFKNCILTKTKDMCDPDKKGSLMQKPRQVPYGSEKPLNVTAFSIQVLDKSLAFIAQQCASLREEECQELEDINHTVLRPNSKGPLSMTNNDDQLQSAATNDKTEPVTVGSTKFQLPAKPLTQKNGAGTKDSQWGNLNSIIKPVNPGNSGQTQTQGAIKPGQTQGAGGGVFGTAQQRDKPKQDKLSTAGVGGNPGNAGTGGDSKNTANRRLLAWHFVLCASLVALLVGLYGVDARL